MIKKGLDTSFVHYGIRKTDMDLIAALCGKHELEFDWVREELLKGFHDKKLKDQEIAEKGIEKVIEKALQKIK